MSIEKQPPQGSNLSAELQRAQKELAVLYDISNAMRTTLELDHILHIILTGVTAHTGLGFNRAILFLINEKEQCLEPKMAIGPESGVDAKEIWDFIAKSEQDLEDLIDEEKVAHSRRDSPLFESIKALKVPLSDGNNSLLAQVIASQDFIHITPDKMRLHNQDPLLKILNTNEIVLMPLRAKDKVNGVIVADNLFTGKPIAGEDLKMLAMLANQAGLAIENSQLYEMIRHKSHTDAVTGMWNHGFFQQQLSDEIETSKNNKTPLSLLLLDIDNFKKLNDQYGHQVGDQVLREMATVLNGASRSIDFVCRYGGEEFSIILPQTSKEQACTIAERLRQNIESHVFTPQQLSITASIGIATFPIDGPAKEDLITLADKAMYKAKFGGKNQISIA